MLTPKDIAELQADARRLKPEDQASVYNFLKKYDAAKVAKGLKHPPISPHFSPEALANSQRAGMHQNEAEEVALPNILLPAENEEQDQDQ